MKAVLSCSSNDTRRSPSAMERHIANTNYVIRRLEEAGATLMALPGGNGSANVSSGMPDVVRSVRDAYGWSKATVRWPVPSPERISEMEEAISWPSLISGDQVLLRRIVGARMLVHPISERHLHSWRRIGEMLQLDYRLVQRRHAEAIEIITTRQKFIFSYGSNGSKYGI